MHSKSSSIVGGGHKEGDDQSSSSSTSNSSPSITSSSQHHDGHSTKKKRHQVIFFTAYILFGILHELFHVLVAKIIILLRSSSNKIIAQDPIFASLTAVGNNNWHHQLTTSNIGKFLTRAIFGRYTVITIPSSTTINVDGSGCIMSNGMAASIITHSGWIMSILLAVGIHYYYWYHVRLCNTNNNNTKNTTKHSSCYSWWVVVVEAAAPTIILAAYITAMESITSDLMGFVPKMVKNLFLIGSGSNTAFPSTNNSSDNNIPQQFQLLLHCGNFGILLINSQWINIDGGKRALNVLEKMVEVTMMRGAQSGGVVTFEPTSSGVTVGGGGGKDDTNPVIRGVRSRVVNAKRTVLSKGVRKKNEKDNCSLLSGGKLKGWNDVEFNATAGSSSGTTAAKRLVRGFFGHTRFATSSKASLDGTHPHQWTPRRTLTCYGFQSKEGAVQGEENWVEGGGSEHGSMHSSRHAVGTGMGNVGQVKDVMRVAPKGQLMGVENFVTHNGKGGVVGERSVNLFDSSNIVAHTYTLLAFIITTPISHR